VSKGIEAYYEYLRNRLTGKGYKPIQTIQPLQLAFFKRGVLNAPYIIAVKDMSKTTDRPKEILSQVEEWFNQYVGGGGGNGLIMFVYNQTLAMDLDEIKSISGIVYAGAHDLFTGKHWVSGYWEQDLYDD
jgi:hypothetical protein